jgi:2-polyprenyl-3-methyl-5-hydroxy-6-metoxy-1,4-benzoquinol methylase
MALSLPEGLSNEDFIDFIYQKMLGRGPDAPGKAHQLKFLRQGNSRLSLVLNIIEAPEFIRKIIRENIQVLPIRDERPENYEAVYDIAGKEKFWVFRVKNDDDFDWLERKIIENAYYERPGVWGFDVDEDKQLLAEIAAEFEPLSVLDFGCANGPILKCLKDKGIYGEGVEISRMALDKAFPEIRENIHFGDLLAVALPRSYDVVLGLDIFEHLNPNKLDNYLVKIFGLVSDGGYLYANIPAYGEDAVFGEIFRINYRAWEDDVAQGRCFRAIPVDDYGYPKNGHIICADTGFWVNRFEDRGFKREFELEKALHEKYDGAMERVSVARKSYYLFSKNADLARNLSILKSLRRQV